MDDASDDGEFDVGVAVSEEELARHLLQRKRRDPSRPEDGPGRHPGGAGSTSEAPSSADDDAGRRRKRKRRRPDGEAPSAPAERPGGSSAGGPAPPASYPRQRPLRGNHVGTRTSLPVHAMRDEIVARLASSEVLLVVAETGSGKSTQVPAYIHGSGMLATSSGEARSAVPAGGDGTDANNTAGRRYGRCVCVTQPRRVAAVTLASRVASELGVEVGTTVGHRVRFDDATDVRGKGSTRVVYATDGMLLREAVSDPLLRRYGAVCLDEAHERSLQTDVLFGVVRRAMAARRRQDGTDDDGGGTSDGATAGGGSGYDRDDETLRLLASESRTLGLPPLKVCVMSATLDVSTFRDFFPTASVVRVPGRTFPVDVVYAEEAVEDHVDAALNAVVQICRHDKCGGEDGEENEGGGGDILVFLTGQDDIEDMAALLGKYLEDRAVDDEDGEDGKDAPRRKRRDVVQDIRGIGTSLHRGGPNRIVDGTLICVLYASLPPEQQLLAFRPKPEGVHRKVILATNIAETSVTLDGVRYVVDCGLHKSREYRSSTGMESLSVSDISKAQAAQRTGRAGRVGPGLCLRLYTEDHFDGLDENATPEILRVNLAQVVLQLKGMGVHDPRSFGFLTPPTDDGVESAFALLKALGALDGETSDLTPYGKEMAKLPLDPIYAHLLLQSGKFECVSEVLTAVAMLSADNIFYRPSSSGASAADDDGESGNGGGPAARAASAHRRFASHEGDLPTLLNVYNAWRAEAHYVPSVRSSGGQSHKRRRKKCPPSKTAHGDWCTQNYVNGRALVRAEDVRRQLNDLCGRVGMDVGSTCREDMTRFYRCLCAGLGMRAAVRLPANNPGGGGGGSGRGERRGSGYVPPSRGRYRTRTGGDDVNVHPTSFLFGRNPPPRCVVYTDLLRTTRLYIRGVTQVREEWLDAAGE